MDHIDQGDKLRIARRGVEPEDSRWFSEEYIQKLITAQEEFKWLLDRGYKMSPITEFVGGHHQLSARQRTALQRATASSVQIEKRKSKEIPLVQAKDKDILVDGFNLIITLEVALSKGTLILGNDGCIRDLAGLRGTYSIIDKTEKALELIGNGLKDLNIKSAKFLLDSPVSNSGRLKNRILEHSNNWNFSTVVELVPNADPVLAKEGNIVTSDSIILDECESWFNISRFIVERYIVNPWIVKLNY